MLKLKPWCISLNIFYQSYLFILSKRCPYNTNLIKLQKKTPNYHIERNMLSSSLFKIHALVASCHSRPMYIPCFLKCIRCFIFSIEPEKASFSEHSPWPNQKVFDLCGCIRFSKCRRFLFVSPFPPTPLQLVS